MSAHPDALDLMARGFARLDAWEAGHDSAALRAAPHAALAVDADRLDAALGAFLDRLTAPPRGDAPGNYPFGHPRYAGQMLKPPHPVALAAYAIAARVNPNNHALDGGPPTAEMEKEVVADLAAMVGLPALGAGGLGHLTGGGTVANLEALYIAREETGGATVLASADAHYTHRRMCGVLGLPFEAVATDDAGHLDLGALEARLAAGGVGTVVLTAATTGLGVVDPIAQAIPLCRAHGARVHVDAAYGGFFRLLADEGAPALGGFPAADFRAIAGADSVVIDPHKHGLQPYGCGCVLFRDAAVGRHYRHDSPYTYFTSAELHLGEISLECSRPGAAAAALWLTLQALPLTADGLGAVQAAGLRAARDLAARLDTSDVFTLVGLPETDIVAYAPRAATWAEVDAASQRIFDAGMTDPEDPLFVSLYRLDAARLARLAPDLGATGEAPDGVRVLRSVLMKPSHETATGWLADRLDSLAAASG